MSVGAIGGCGLHPCLCIGLLIMSYRTATAGVLLVDLVMFYIIGQLV